ncbi:hypothetical protein LguiA_029640 [Lonicera macranthoides]
MGDLLGSPSVTPPLFGARRRKETPGWGTVHGTEAGMIGRKFRGRVCFFGQGTRIG